MLELGFVKPLLASLALPPAAPLLLALLGLLLAWRKHRGGLALTALALAGLWLLACHGTAVWLARQASLPVAFSGGVGWAAQVMQPVSEADVAGRVALQDYGVTLRWRETASRDTWENAGELAPLLRKDGVQRIALVTDAWHMPRSLAAFEQAGLSVTPAPMGFILPLENSLLQWLPSAQGLLASRQVLRECLGLAVARLLPAG